MTYYETSKQYRKRLSELVEWSNVFEAAQFSTDLELIKIAATALRRVSALRNRVGIDSKKMEEAARREGIAGY